MPDVIYGPDDKAIYLLPIGASIIFAGTTPPSGFLPHDGAAISRTVYAKLFERIGTTWGDGDGTTTFNVPPSDTRFPRFSGDGVPVGTMQEDAIRNITGGFTVRANFNQSAMEASGVFSSALDYSGAVASDLARLGAEYPPTTYIFNPGNVVPVAAENRPKAAAFLGCIKYA